MRSDFTMDAHPGWHAILGSIYRWQKCSTETLVVVAVAGLMLLVSAAVLFWLRRPEAWLAALLAAALAQPEFVKRLALGRPFLFTMAVFLTLLFVWSRSRTARPRLGELAVSIGLIAAAAWIHGTFYQLVLPAAALVLSGRWRQGFWFGGCWAVGSFLGAALTGHPWQFLDQSVRWLLAVFGSHAFTRQLVVEFYPADGDCFVVLAVLAMISWRARSPDWKARELVEPIFMMALAGWILGLANGRFWVDWGLPATALWLALEFQKQFEPYLGFASVERFLVTSGLGLALYLAAHRRPRLSLDAQSLPAVPQCGRASAHKLVARQRRHPLQRRHERLLRNLLPEPQSDLALHPGVRAGTHAPGGPRGAPQRSCGMAGTFALSSLG